MTRTCCRKAEGRGLSRLHVDTTALTMPAISTAISRCAGRCGDRPRRSCHRHVPTQSLSPRQTFACSDPSALGKCGVGFRLLRPIDASARFARRLAKGCGNPHHEGLAEPAKRLLVRPDVSGSFGDIVIVFVDNDPAALAVAKACPPALDIRNFKAILSACGGWVVNARSARCVRPSFASRTATTTQARSGLPAFGFAVLVLPRPEIGISNHLTGQELTTHRHTSRPRQPVDLRGEELPMLLRHLGSAMDAARSPPVRIRS